MLCQGERLLDCLLMHDEQQPYPLLLVILFIRDDVILYRPMTFKVTDGIRFS